MKGLVLCARECGLWLAGHGVLFKLNDPSTHSCGRANGWYNYSPHGPAL